MAIRTTLPASISPNSSADHADLHPNPIWFSNCERRRQTIRRLADSALGPQDDAARVCFRGCEGGSGKRRLHRSIDRHPARRQARRGRSCSCAPPTSRFCRRGVRTHPIGPPSTFLQVPYVAPFCRQRRNTPQQVPPGGRGIRSLNIVPHITTVPRRQAAYMNRYPL